MQKQMRSPVPPPPQKHYDPKKCDQQIFRPKSFSKLNLFPTLFIFQTKFFSHKQFFPDPKEVLTKNYVRTKTFYGQKNI